MRGGSLAGRARAVGAALLLAAAAGCGVAPTPSDVLLLTDVSRSGLAESSQIRSIAEATLLAEVDALSRGSTVVTWVFANQVSTACEPLAVGVPVAGNSEELRAVRAQLSTALPGAFDRAVQCAINDVYGSSAAGSAIFASVVESVRYARARGLALKRVVLVSDGCEASPDLPRTCRRSNLRTEGFADSVVAGLPAGMLPDLREVTLEVIGLGKGKGGLSAAELSVLREVWQKFAERSGAQEVRFL